MSTGWEAFDTETETETETESGTSRETPPASEPAEPSPKHEGIESLFQRMMIARAEANDAAKRARKLADQIASEMQRQGCTGDLMFVTEGNFTYEAARNRKYVIAEDDGEIEPPAGWEQWTVRKAPTVEIRVPQDGSGGSEDDLIKLGYQPRIGQWSIKRDAAK